jgi:nitrous oxidase accessory protein
MIALLAVLLLAPPDTLRFGPGVHRGPLVISRSTVVLGAPGAVIRGSGRGSVIQIHSAGTILRGLTIEHSGRDMDHDDAGVMIAADSVLLEDIQIRDILFGVYLRKVRDVTLRRLDIEGRQGLPESQTGNGIHLHYSRGITIADSRIAWVRDGMYFEYTDSAVVRGNTVTRSRFGLHYMFSHNNRFERNVFTHGAAGAVVMNSSGLTIRDNVFAWNSGSRSFGLILQTATAPVVERNLFVGNGIGTFFDNVIRGRYLNNLVAENWLGLQLYGNSEQTKIIGNAILGNTFEVTGGAQEGAYIFCADGNGNYWAGAALADYDLDGDGVLDEPYAASSPLVDLAQSREGLRLFLGSPAARTLEWAEHTFPVFDVDQAEDACPAARPSNFRMLAALPSRSEEGGTNTQYAAAAGSLLVGMGILLVPLRARRVPRRKGLPR